MDDRATADSPDSVPGGADVGDGAVVLLVRHGETPTTGSVLPGRAPGLHLSPSGEAQARRTADRIAALGRVDAVHSSPLERTSETAAVIARTCRSRMVVNDELTECDFGDWTGAELRELRQRREWVAVQRNPSAFRFPGGESFTDIQARATKAVAEIVDRHPGGMVVVVTHADVIKTVVAAALGVPLDLFQRIVVAPCSVTAVRYTLSGPTVLTVNDTGADFAAMFAASDGRDAEDAERSRRHE